MDRSQKFSLCLAKTKIVAVDRTSNYPAAVSRFPVVGYVRALSAEGVLSLGPSLVLGEDDMGPLEVVSQLKLTGIEIRRVPEEHSAVGIVEKISVLLRY